MKRHASVIGSHTGLWTMMLGAGVLAVLMLACAGTAAGTTWVVDDGGSTYSNYLGNYRGDYKEEYPEGKRWMRVEFGIHLTT